MEAVIAKLEEQDTDEEVIASYKEQMTSTQRLQLEKFGRTVNKYVDVLLSVLFLSVFVKPALFHGHQPPRIRSASSEDCCTENPTNSVGAPKT